MYQMIDKIVQYPFPHVIIDNFLEPVYANKMYEEFYCYEDEIWEEKGKLFINEHAKKKYLTNERYFPNSFNYFLSIVKSKTFMSMLERRFGFENIIFDDNMYGAGMQIAKNGSHLSPHIDFNYNSDLGAYRCLNLLFYLNKGWAEHFGGSLQFYDNEMKIKSIVPKYNRCAIFATTNKSFHGHNEIKHPENINRKSFNVYYYIKKPINEISKKPHKTIWRK
tara:strand:+ start:2979 stop:3641 length:663 start_codon:yes stop_codon:yes gene_type:complete